MKSQGFTIKYLIMQDQQRNSQKYFMTMGIGWRACKFFGSQIWI